MIFLRTVEKPLQIRNDLVHPDPTSPDGYREDSVYDAVRRRELAKQKEEGTAAERLEQIRDRFEPRLSKLRDRFWG
jgi:hypothetical protein